jgi:hypothetical protein
MTLDPRKSAAVFSLLCAWLALAFASFVPVWPFGNESDSSMWTSADWFCREFVEIVRNPDDRWALGLFFQQYQRLPLLSATVFISGGLLGRLWFWYLRERD